MTNCNDDGTRPMPGSNSDNSVTPSASSNSIISTIASSSLLNSSHQQRESMLSEVFPWYTTIGAEDDAGRALPIRELSSEDVLAIVDRAITVASSIPSQLLDDFEEEEDEHGVVWRPERQ